MDAWWPYCEEHAYGRVVLADGIYRTHELAPEMVGAEAAPPTADRTTTSRDVIRAAIDGYFHDGKLRWMEAEDLAERIDRALFGDGSHEESAATWRANAAEEYRR